MKLPVLRCQHCKHEWIPRRNQLPAVCPICKRKDWSAPRARHLAKEKAQATA